MTYARRTPWGLTDAEADALGAMAEHGTNTAAADAIGVSVACLRSRLRSARIRMAGHKPSARFAVALEPMPTVVACVRYAQWAAHPSEWGGL